MRGGEARVVKTEEKEGGELRVMEGRNATTVEVAGRVGGVEENEEQILK